MTDLAEASGVSRAMINRIERGESSPTATVLGKLSGAFQLSISALLAEPEPEPVVEPEPEPEPECESELESEPEPGLPPANAPRRSASIPQWRDPETGYRRRQISGSQFPASVAEIRLPPGARVPYPAAAFAFVRHLIWVLSGTLTFHQGSTVHELGPGDTLELGAPVACAYQNTTDAECRYVVVVIRAASGTPR